MANLWEGSGQVLVDGNGTPYASWKLYTYDTGTTTPKATYSNAGNTSSNANPVVADSNGRMGDVYFAAGRYKLVFKTSADVTIDTIDPYDSSQQVITATAAPSPAYPFMEYYNSTDGHRYRRNAANNAWIDLGLVDSLGNASTVAQILAATDTTSFGTPDSIGALWQRGTDIASATTLSLPSGGGGVFNITGTTTITGIGSAVGGRTVKVKFAGSCQLTHNATSFIMPGGQNLVTQAGDTAEFINEAATDATGSNWRCFQYQRAAGQPVAFPAPLTKTADYTATAADRNGVIRYSGQGANCTLTLPAASGRAGFTLTLINDDSTFYVTIDPNGAELLDGVASKSTMLGGVVTIICDGTGWRTISGKYRMFTPYTSVTAAALISLTHNFNTRPANIWAEIKCNTIDAGWAVGDIITVGAGGVTSTGPSPMCTLYADSSTAKAQVQSTGSWSAGNKSTGAASTLTLARWDLRLFAEL